MFPHTEAPGFVHRVLGLLLGLVPYGGRIFRTLGAADQPDREDGRRRFKREFQAAVVPPILLAVRTDHPEVPKNPHMNHAVRTEQA